MCFFIPRNQFFPGQVQREEESQQYDIRLAQRKGIGDEDTIKLGPVKYTEAVGPTNSRG